MSDYVFNLVSSGRNIDTSDDSSITSKVELVTQVGLVTLLSANATVCFIFKTSCSIFLRIMLRIGSSFLSVKQSRYNPASTSL